MNKLKTDLLTNDRSLNSCWVAPESRRTSPAKVGEFRSELVPSEHILASPRNFTGVSICSPASIYHAYVYVKIQKNISWGKRFEVARGYEEIVQDMTGFPKIGSCQTRSQIKVTEKYWNGGGPKPCLAHIMYIYNHHICVYILYIHELHLWKVCQIQIKRFSLTRICASCGFQLSSVALLWQAIAMCKADSLDVLNLGVQMTQGESLHQKEQQFERILPNKEQQGQHIAEPSQH